MDEAMAPFQQPSRSLQNIHRQHEATERLLVREPVLDGAEKRHEDDIPSGAGDVSLISMSPMSTQLAAADGMSLSRINPLPSTTLSWVPPIHATTSPLPTNSPLASWPDASSSQRGKALSPWGDNTNNTTAAPGAVSPTTTSSLPIRISAATALGEAASASPTAALPTIVPSSTSLSPVGKQVLISAGSIGAFILIGAIIYIIMRLMNVDVTGRLRRYGREDRGGFWKSNKSFPENNDFASTYPTLNDEKPGSTSRKLYTPIVIPSMSMTVPVPVEALSRADKERQTLVREALLQKYPPYGTTPPQPLLLKNPPFVSNQLPPQTQTPKPSLQMQLQPQIQQQPQPEPQELPAISVVPVMPVMPPMPPEPAELPPQEPHRARQPSIPYSELSSLSSGFGDAKIDVPESGPTKPNIDRKSYASRASRHKRVSRLSHSSWSSRSRDRDTIYTTASEDSVPRFRTVNSWVNQQAKRIHRQRESDREVDNMPDMPVPAGSKKASHQRTQTEATDPAFRYHPGDEVPISRGTRVPSAILDKII